MTTVELRHLLMEAIHESVDFDALGDKTVTTFEDAGVLTMDEGLVLRLADGTEFHLTVQQSSAAFAQG